MIVTHVVVGMFAENTWIVACEKTREAVLVDPGAEADRIILREIGQTFQLPE